MPDYIKYLIQDLSLRPGTNKLVGKYKTMKLDVTVKEGKVIDLCGWVYRKDDWDIMYDILREKNRIIEVVAKKYLS